MSFVEEAADVSRDFCTQSEVKDVSASSVQLSMGQTRL